MSKTTMGLVIYMGVQFLQTVATSMQRGMDTYDYVMMAISALIACGTTAHAFLNQNSDLTSMPKAVGNIPGIKETEG